MHEDFLTSAGFGIDDTTPTQPKEKDFNSIFDNLTEDVANVSKYNSEVTKKQKSYESAQKELYEERQELEKTKLDYENYFKFQGEELKKIKNQTEEYIALQTDKLRKAEDDFKNSMTNSLSQLELEKKELEINKESFLQEKAQFETYRSLELSRINQAKEQIEKEKEQFAKYKEIAIKKIDLDNKNLEQQCLKFKEIMGQFNSSFKPILNNEEE